MKKPTRKQAALLAQPRATCKDEEAFATRLIDSAVQLVTHESEGQALGRLEAEGA